MTITHDSEETTQDILRTTLGLKPRYRYIWDGQDLLGPCEMCGHHPVVEEPYVVHLRHLEEFARAIGGVSRARIPQLRQLPAPPTAALRRRLGHYPRHPDQRTATTLSGVEPRMQRVQCGGCSQLPTQPVLGTAWELRSMNALLAPASPARNPRRRNEPDVRKRFAPRTGGQGGRCRRCVSVSAAEVWSFRGHGPRFGSAGRVAGDDAAPAPGEAYAPCRVTMS